MKQKSKHIKTLMVAIVVLVTIIATAVLAAYLKNSIVIPNSFSPADSTKPIITEKFENNVKEDVFFKVGNPGYPVYVRAKIVVTWQDKNGNVYYLKPQAGIDYDIDLNLTDWKLIKENENDEEGFYYYNSRVESNGETTNLINICKPKADAPADGYSLSVEIIVQTIQAIGTTDADTYEDGTPAWEDVNWDGAETWTEPNN
ncbi:MAG: hypothetical protein J1E81_08820 [Eubacterium sp.]|nr:hypothetical protein [Eubacterium sp.]